MTQEVTKPGFAVLDFETNGLGPWEDILEIGVVLLDSEMRIEAEFGTLVDNRRRVKNAWAHGIDRPQLAGAPTEEVAFLYLLSLLSGRYVTAHNAPFEKRFLDFHGDAHGVSGADTAAVKFIDTIPIAQELCGKRKLTDVSKALEIEHNAHTALSDAQVTAIILQRAFASNSKKLELQLLEASIWPQRFKNATQLQSIHRISSESLFRARSSWLNSIEFEEVNLQENSKVYRELLRLFSLNFELSEAEKKELTEVIKSLKLTRETVATINQAVLAEASGIKFPSALLNRRSYLLTNLANSLGIILTPEILKNNGVGLSLLRNGHKIMLSGKLSENQDVLNSKLERRGFEITNYVDKADIVVIGYSDSTNKQIQEARALRLPVLAELSFTIFLG